MLFEMVGIIRHTLQTHIPLQGYLIRSVNQNVSQVTQHPAEGVKTLHEECSASGQKRLGNTYEVELSFAPDTCADSVAVRRDWNWDVPLTSKSSMLDSGGGLHADIDLGDTTLSS